MIRSEREFKEAVERLEQDRIVAEKQRAELKKRGMSKEEAERAMAPLLAFHQQLVEEVEWYERVKRQDFETLNTIEAVGRLLIALRIAGGLTQKDLAKCLGVPESQVSRDERNEYHGITVERVQKVLDVFGVHLTSRVEPAKRLNKEEILAGASR
jgi:ribosome-binding protein aMBF1 (putative translation factor)